MTCPAARAVLRSMTVAAAIAGAVPAALSAQEMIEVGGGKLQLVRSGQGSPTVVFDAGLVDPKTWSGILPKVAEFTAAVSFSHAGIGASEALTGPRSARRAAEELHTLLQRAGVQPPYVLVGHSMGGLFSRVFAIMYSQEVAGLVLIDGVHERQVVEFTKLDSAGFTRRRALGLQGLNPAQRAEMDGLSPILSSGTLGIPGKLPDVPMVVLTSMLSAANQAPGATKVWRDLQSEIFQSTTHGMHIVTSRSGHLIHQDEPDLVVNAIRWVVDAVRSRK